MRYSGTGKAGTVDRPAAQNGAEMVSHEIVLTTDSVEELRDATEQERNR